MIFEEIPIVKIEEEFNRFLKKPNNSRIIFSGPFGCGKTYFLDKFFTKRNDFFTIRISPVNYVTAQNEDIFELIKFDILFQMLTRDGYPNSALHDREEILKFLHLIDPVKKLEGLLEKLDKTNNDWTKIIDLKSWLKLEPQSTNYEEYKSWKNFLDEHFKKHGRVNERNTLSKLIYILLSALCEPEATNDSEVADKNGYKESVLIIDDLDRVDPEHIFRILNVFAAHVDIDDKTNKFGFNRIITVCDVRNIREIFAARYGQSTDFNGYIDKFYSQYVFDFGNSYSLEKEVIQFLNSVSTESDNKPRRVKPFSPVESNFLLYLLIVLVKTNHLTLRTLKNKWGMNYTLRSAIEGDQVVLSAHSYHIIEIFYFLSQVVGSFPQLDEIFSKIENDESSRTVPDKFDDNNHLKMGFIMPILDRKGGRNVNGQQEYILPTNNVKIVYSILDITTSPHPAFAQLMQDNYNQTRVPDIPDIFPYLNEAFKYLKRLKVI